MTANQAGEVVAFDFDGTLTRRDTLLPFLGKAVGSRSLLASIGRAKVAWITAGKHGRNVAKGTLIRATLKGTREQHLEELGAAYADHLIACQFRDDTVARLLAHKEIGHRIIIVSASLSYYLDPVATHYGIELPICCRPVVDRHGVLTGELDSANVRGQVKADRLKDLLGEEATLAYAYGNNDKADGAMLTLARNPVMVGRQALPDLSLEIINPSPTGSGSFQDP